MDTVCHQLPANTLLLVIAGSPCQQLTTIGPGRGELGICGEESSLVLTVPLIAGELQRRRPDIRVHVLLENAGSMLPIHREAIGEMLGVSAHNHAPVVDAAGWITFTRRRTLFATVADDERWTPSRRATPGMQGGPLLLGHTQPWPP